MPVQLPFGIHKVYLFNGLNIWQLLRWYQAEGQYFAGLAAAPAHIYRVELESNKWHYNSRCF